MRWLFACTAIALIACGRFGYEEYPALGEPDSGPNPDLRPRDAASGADAPDTDAASTDTSLGPFGEPIRIAELSDPDADDDDPSLTGDLLEIYFKSDRGSPGHFDIWRAQRGAGDEPWGKPELVKELSSDAYDGTPDVSLDGLVIFLASSRKGGPGGTDIWMATRATRDEPWCKPALVAELSSPRDEWAAVTDASGTHAILTRATSEHSLDLFAASRASDRARWVAPTPLVNLATTVYEADAHLDPSGLHITFAAELAGGQGRDLYQAERPTVDFDFEAPVPLVELASSGRDEDPWLSVDERVIVFSSDRSGDQELYWAFR